MPIDLHDSGYRVVSPYPALMPAVTAIFVPTMGGGDYRTDEAVVDSGSEYTWVPTRVPDEHGWDPIGVEPVAVWPLGGPEVNAPGFLTTVRIAQGEWPMPVFQLPSTSSLQCVLVGQGLLRKLFVQMDGPRRHLLLQVP